MLRFAGARDNPDLGSNDGEIFHYGSRIPIRWEAANAYPSMRIVVSLMCCGTGCTYGTKLADLYSDSRELNWLIENRTPAGQYRIRCAVVTGIAGVIIRRSKTTAILVSRSCKEPSICYPSQLNG